MANNRDLDPAKLHHPDADAYDPNAQAEAPPLSVPQFDMRELTGWEASANYPTAEQLQARATAGGAEAEPITTQGNDRDEQEYISTPGYGHIEVRRGAGPRELSHLDTERRLAQEAQETARQAEQDAAAAGGEEEQLAAQSRQQTAEGQQARAEDNAAAAEQDLKRLGKGQK